MSDTRTGGTKLALVLGAIIFVVSFIMLLWIGDYSFLAALFLALLLAFLSAIVLYLAFGDGDLWSGGASASTSSKPASATAAAAGVATAAGAASTSSGAADAKAAEAAKREADANAAAKAAEEAAAREAEAAQKAAEAAKAEADAKAAAEAEASGAANRESEDDALAARKAADAERVAEARAEEERKAAEAERLAAKRANESTHSTGSGDLGEDYDGDGIHEGENEGTRPAGLDGPRGGVADDLKMIKGVGLKMEQLVNSLGFWHFDQLAAWTDDEVAWVDANLKGFKGRVSRDKWVEQAKLLAAGGETEFSKRVEGGDVY